MTITKKCAVSGKEFQVSEAELEFRAKQSPTFAGQKFPLPEPHLCPEERIRQMNLHRNEQYLHHNKSALSGKSLIAIYRPEFEGRIYSYDEWFSDSWNPLDFGHKYDESASFFENYKRLQSQIPRAATVGSQNENSDFTTGAGHCRNCYLINCSEHVEDSMYGKLLQRSKDICDSSYIYDSELLYECFNCEKCYDSKYLQNCKNCSESAFLKNCIGCKSCFGCVNLRNKEYYFLNTPCTKEEYEKKLVDLNLDKSSALSGMRAKFQEFAQQFPYKFAEINNCENCTGDYLINSKNCHECYDVSQCEDCFNVRVGDNIKDFYDCTNVYTKGELCLNTLGIINVFNCNFCLYVFDSNDLWYCEQCYNCQDCFGCVGLRNKQYCIFNVQFPDKASYEAEVARMITHMQTTGEWGTYIPKELSPFPYNDSVAHYYFPLTETEATAKGYKWANEKSSNSTSAVELPETVDEASDDICAQVLTCQETGKPYKIVAPELAFYRKMNLPIPRVCPDKRHWNRMAQRNDRVLYTRDCPQCDVTMASTYGPERPETVVCEACYLKTTD